MPRRKPPLPNMNDLLRRGSPYTTKFDGVKRILVTCERVENRPLGYMMGMRAGWSAEQAASWTGYLTPCGNSTCTGGGFPLNETIEDMIRKKETKRVEEALICVGKEKMGRASYRDCLHQAGPVKFEIEYETPPGP